MAGCASFRSLHRDIAHVSINTIPDHPHTAIFSCAAREAASAATGIEKAVTLAQL